MSERRVTKVMSQCNRLHKILIQAKCLGYSTCDLGYLQSNLQTKAVNSPSEYPIREFLNTGLKVSINTDNRTVSNTSLTKELQFIQNTYGIQEEEIRLMMKNAVDTAFATDEVKARLYSELGIKG